MNATCPPPFSFKSHLLPTNKQQVEEKKRVAQKICYYQYVTEHICFVYGLTLVTHGRLRPLAATIPH